MTTSNEKAAAEEIQSAPQGQISSADIVDYLRSNPDFLTRPGVFEAILPQGRWNEEGVVDMQQFMLERLREEIENLRNCAREVIDTSRSNMSTQTRTHAAVLAMLSAGDFEHLLRIITDDVSLLLDVDVAVVCLEAARNPAPQLASPLIKRLEPGSVDRLLGAENDTVLANTFIDEGGDIFGEAAGLVRSAALARIRPGLTTPGGIMALGSRSHAFHPNQGSELVSFLARVMERCLHRWLEKAG
ncbi:MAG: DUF484 family protein [Rhodospirillales bacterium]